DGAVVARKLIGATARGELAGYRTYAAAHEDAIRTALDALLRDFAALCRLRLSNTATPEKLHDGFWYDDGNEPWVAAGQPHVLEKPPSDWPGDAAAVAEWNAVQAILSGDVMRLAGVLSAVEGPVAEMIVYRRLRDEKIPLEGIWFPDRMDQHRLVSLWSGE